MPDGKIEAVFTFYEGSRGPFLDGYGETFGELPPSFPLRSWLYRGIYLVMTVNEYRRGNKGFEPSPKWLGHWLSEPVPEVMT